MKFTTLLTIIITGYVIYYAYQIIHDLFFTKGVLSDELHIEETSQDDGLTQMCGGYTIDELHNALREEHDNPGSTALKDVMKLYE